MKKVERNELAQSAVAGGCCKTSSKTAAAKPVAKKPVA